MGGGVNGNSLSFILLISDVTSLELPLYPCHNQKIGFIWSVTDQLWENNFELLKQHYTENGTFDVAHKKNRKLAAFVSRLRTAMSHKNQGLVQQECKYHYLYM